MISTFIEGTRKPLDNMVPYTAPSYLMSKSPKKLWDQVQNHQKGVRFSDFCRLVEWFGFVRKGGKGSHQTYFHSEAREILDLQPLGGEAKPYQIKQFLRLVDLYHLRENHNETKSIPH